MGGIAAAGITIECEVIVDGQPQTVGGTFYLDENGAGCSTPSRQVLPPIGWNKFGYVRPAPGVGTANSGYHDYNNDGVIDNNEDPNNTPQAFCIPRTSGTGVLGPASPGLIAGTAARYADRIVWQLNDHLGGARPCGNPN